MSALKFSSEEQYDTAAHSISWKMQCDTVDVKASDRLVFDSKTYVVYGVRDHIDTLGKHFSVFIRQVASNIHTAITFKRLSDYQDSFDPLLNEYSTTKAYTETISYVLIDPVNSTKSMFVKIVDSGKLEETDYIMTLDLPETIELSDRIVFNSEEYEIKWRIFQPYQTLVGLKKSFSNY